MKMPEIHLGDIVEILWQDVFAVDDVVLEDLDKMKTIGPTVCWGKIIKIEPEFLTIAFEMAEPHTDGTTIQIMPFALIKEIRVLK